MNKFAICFTVIAVFVLNVIGLLFVSVGFCCWRDHVLSSSVCVLCL